VKEFEDDLGTFELATMIQIISSDAVSGWINAVPGLVSFVVNKQSMAFRPFAVPVAMRGD
jgi:hypothetical protein